MKALRCVCGAVVESDGDLLAAVELHLATDHRLDFVRTAGGTGPKSPSPAARRDADVDLEQGTFDREVTS